MNKYIIEIKPEYEDSFKGLMLLGAKDSNLFVDTVAVEDLEELNSDYINEHFGDLQDTAYQKGINDGSLDVKQRVEGAYQRGLNDAWEAARKIVEMSAPQYWELFDTYKENLFGKISASEAINKIKAYEEKQKADDKIRVGDEVFNIPTKTKGILLEPETEHLLATVIVPSLRWRTINIRHANLKKTGKHYDIEKLLEAMKA